MCHMRQQIDLLLPSLLHANPEHACAAVLCKFERIVIFIHFTGWSIHAYSILVAVYKIVFLYDT